MRAAAARLVWYSIVLSFAACAHYQARPTPDLQRDGAMGQTIEGVRLMVGRAEESYGAFEADLKGQGVFPLLLHYQNDSAAAVSAARRDILLTSQGVRCKQLSLGDVSERIGFSPAGRYFAWSYGLLGIGIVPGTIDHFKAEEANRTLSDDLVAKELQDFTLAPSGRALGFVFFECPNGAPPTEVRELLSSSDGRVFHFVVPFVEGR